MDGGLLKTLQSIKLTSHIKRCSDDDFVDRINNYYTPLILAVFTIVICTKSYIVGEPLQCWVPIHFSENWEKYSESYCYIKNTYYVPNTQELPNDKTIRRNEELQYYQWVPFVLGLQAVLFLIPAVFWKFSSWQAKIHLKPLIQRGVLSAYESGEKRITTLKQIAEHIRNCLFQPQLANMGNEQYIENTKDANARCGLLNSGIYITSCYFFTKILYILNIVCQFFIVHSFLKTDFFYGFNLVKKISQGHDWQTTGLFPRVTICDFTIPRIGQPISHSMQCVLVINLFNEKIYIFLWFWLAFLFVITIISLCAWIGRMLFGRKLSNFISIKSDYRTKANLNTNLVLCESEMNCDVFFALRMIDSNCGLMTTRRITEHLLEYYKNPIISDKYNSLPPNYHELGQIDKSSKSSEIA